MIHWVWLLPAFFAGLLAGGIVMALAAAAGETQRGKN